jgi:hypothetical protein
MSNTIAARETGFEPGKGSAYDYLPQWMDIPGLKETEGQESPLAVVKLFHPLSSWTWYVVEADEKGDICFGLVSGFAVEYGYFSIAELRSVDVVLPVERDLYFEPTPVREVERTLGRGTR